MSISALFILRSTRIAAGAAALAVGISAAPVQAEQKMDDMKEHKAEMVGGFHISGAWIRATPPSAKTAAGYLTIMNPGAEDDQLIGVRVDFAKKAELHTMEMKDGVMSMREMEGGFSAPAGGEKTFAPGGDHLMFMGLTEPMVDGEERSVVLIFEKAGEVALTFPVKRANGKMKGHGAHGGDMKHSE